MLISLFVGYDMYPEVEEGDLNHIEKGDNIVDFWRIFFLLSNHMIKYNPTNCKYSGDTNMIPDTYNNKYTRDKIKED